MVPRRKNIVRSDVNARNRKSLVTKGEAVLNVHIVPSWHRLVVKMTVSCRRLRRRRKNKTHMVDDSYKKYPQLINSAVCMPAENAVRVEK